MVKKFFFGMLLLTAVFSACPAPGQEMAGGKWWHNPAMSRQLNLTEEEKSRLDEEFVKSRRKLIDLKSREEKERFELENLLERQDLDKKAIMRQFRKLKKARADLADERFHFVLQIRKILGNERFQQIKTLYRSIRKRRAEQNKARFRRK